MRGYSFDGPDYLPRRARTWAERYYFDLLPFRSRGLQDVAVVVVVDRAFEEDLPLIQAAGTLTSEVVVVDTDS